MRTRNNIIKLPIFFILIFAFFLFFSAKVNGQSACPNSDFSLGNFTDWQGSTGENNGGNYTNVVNGINQGTTNSLPSNAGQQTIINAPGTDPNTGNALSVL